ncbi:MAG TPA: hypothetical protein VEJ63_17295 [Planctomycetota bacterium]|nr:hypothetical protein [Planctomycetota bacterium]
MANEGSVLKPALKTGARETPALTGLAHPMMVLDDDVRRVREMRLERRARLSELKSPRDVRRYQERVQAAIHRAFSPVPKRTPLNARVLGVHESRYARIEKILFESRPNFFVTANLYIPHGVSEKKKAFGVIADCGHSQNGKQLQGYQAFPQRLALNGFMTLLIDPINQGERDQFYGLGKELQDGLSDNCCQAHNMIGKQLELIGEFFGMWRAWDNMRALDYLLTRPELDTRHIGMTGNSGGGTMTTWTWAVEPRLTMAAPSCFVTTFLHNLENELPADCEQYPPGCLGAGLEMADFLIACAPKPVILLGQRRDFFDRRGLVEAHEEIRRVYGILGARDKAQMFMGPEPHRYSWHAQEAMVEFFCRQVGSPTRQRGTIHTAIPDSKIEDNGDNLLVTPKGNVVAYGSTPIYKLTAQTAREQSSRRKTLSGAALQRAIRSVLNLDKTAGTPAGAKNPPHFRVLRPNTFAGYRAARYAVETESVRYRDICKSGIRAFLQKVTKEPGVSLEVEPAITLYLPHLSAEAELCDPKLGGRYLQQDAFYALDVRGTGDSMPVRPPDSDFFASYQYDYMHHGHGVMFGESYFGRRVFDVLRTIDLLASEGVKSIELIGRGQGALHAAYAAVLANHVVKKVTLINAPASYLEWATNPVVRWPASNMPRGVLNHFDLPDIYRALKGRVQIVAPWDCFMEPIGARRLTRARAAAAR